MPMFSERKKSRSGFSERLLNFSQGSTKSRPTKSELLLLGRLGSLALLLDRGLRGGEAGDGHAER